MKLNQPIKNYKEMKKTLLGTAVILHFILASAESIGQAMINAASIGSEQGWIEQTFAFHIQINNPD